MPQADLRLVVDNSADETAFKSASVNFTPRRCASVSKSKKYFGGTPRCRHFFEVSYLTPMLPARSQTVPNVSMGKEYGDSSSPLSTPKRSRPKCPSKKVRISRQCGMGKSAAETDFNAVFRMRTRNARETAGLTQQNLAEALQVSLDTYKKWENRPTSALPRERMKQFSIITRVSLDDLLAPPSPREIALVRPPNKRTA